MKAKRKAKRKTLEHKLKQIRLDSNSEKIGVTILVDKKGIRIRNIDFRYQDDDDEDDEDKPITENKIELPERERLDVVGYFG